MELKIEATFRRIRTLMASGHYDEVGEIVNSQAVHCYNLSDIVFKVE
jgi:hypothetical protein